jgi:hypothetical protein
MRPKYSPSDRARWSHGDRYTVLFRGELDLASAASVEEITRELVLMAPAR